jgi:hypothetical protein
MRLGSMCHSAAWARARRGLLGVLEIGVGVRVVRLGNAVLYEEAGDADGVEPVAGVEAFFGPGEMDVASAGEDESSGAGIFYAGGGIDGERGNGDV